jgi:hypothetical protein
MTLDENLEFAKQAIDHVKKFGIRPTNHPNEDIAVTGPGLKQTRDTAYNRMVLNEEIVRGLVSMRRLDGLPEGGRAASRQAALTDLGEVLHSARCAQASGFGNCDEMACVAFVYLWERSCRPIELMKFSNKAKVKKTKLVDHEWVNIEKKVYDHMWVVIGRAQGSQVGKLSTWGANAVWCDPWQPAGKRFSIQDFVNGKVGSFSSVSTSFLLNTVASVEAGLPVVHFRCER